MASTFSYSVQLVVVDGKATGAYVQFAEPVATGSVMGLLENLTKLEPLLHQPNPAISSGSIPSLKVGRKGCEHTFSTDPIMSRGEMVAVVRRCTACGTTMREQT